MHGGSKGNVMMSLQVRVRNYWEALGVVAAFKAGVNPLSLRRDRISPLQEVSYNLSPVSAKTAWGIEVSKIMWNIREYLIKLTICITKP